MKVIAIQESVGWQKKTIAELLSNLQTYKMEMLSKHDQHKKNKTIAFVVEGSGLKFDYEEIYEETIT